MDSLYDDDSDSDNDRDDLQQYLSTGRRKAHAGEAYFNPIELWIEKKADWPIPSPAATIHFSALAFLRGPSLKLKPKLWALTGDKRLTTPRKLGGCPL